MFPPQWAAQAQPGLAERRRKLANGCKEEERMVPRVLAGSGSSSLAKSSVEA